VLWLFPVYAFMFLGDNFRSFAEHSHPEGDQAADRHRLITYTSNPLERMLVAPMNMNYHTAHHLWPSIPYYNLPTADRLIRHHPDAAGLEWRGSYFAYLLTYWSALPIRECKQARRLPPPTPGAPRQSRKNSCAVVLRRLPRKMFRRVRFAAPLNTHSSPWGSTMNC
jgi:fatty acid desaturase